MNKLFFKDIRDNLFTVDGIWGFVVDTNEEIHETHYLVLVKESSVEVSEEMYRQLTNMVLVLEPEKAKVEAE